MLLAFFHAIKDFDPQANNDPNRRHEGWSNFCGSVGMTDEHVRTLIQSINANVTPPQRTRYPPTRVFQVHSVQHNGAHPPTTMVFSWPPARSVDTPSEQFDGMYDADEYADLMRGVDMDPSALAAKPGELRTNCTTRFGAEHSIRTEGVYRHVTSVFIPYDQIIFACFQTTKLYELPNNTAPPTHEAWSTPQPQQLPPPSTQQQSPVGVQGGHPPGQDWRQPGEYERSGYPPPPAPGPGGHYPPAPDYPPPAHGYGGGAPGGPPGAHQPYPDANAGYHVARLAEPPVHHNHTPPPPPPPSRGGGSTRPLVRPPGDVEKCRGCGTRESPEWRKGENGVKDLCNACGLKLARAVAKREGRQKPRKKDK